MKKIKIGYFADGKWAHEAFRLMIKDETIDIAFIVPRIDTKDFTLKNFSDKYNIDYLDNYKVNSSEFISRVKKYNCDLFISMSFNQIFKNPLINLPPLKTINCHAGKLPFYRGCNVLNWVLINDEKEFGITIHYINEGIDTGDIILQRVFPVADNDNYTTILNTAYIECANILYEAIKLIQNNSVKPVKQDSIHPTGFYCTKRKEGDEIIDWNQGSRKIFNFIRAINQPEGPGARTFLEDGSEIIINRAEEIKSAIPYIGINGSVLKVEESNFLVKTGDSMLKISDYKSNGKIRVGSRLIPVQKI